MPCSAQCIPGWGSCRRGPERDIREIICAATGRSAKCRATIGHETGTGVWTATTSTEKQKENGQSRPVSRVLSRRVVAFPAVADIPLGPALPPASSERPGSAAGHRIAPLCALAPGGACRAARVATGAVRSYRTVSPLPAFAGGFFSVALSRESPRLAVSQHPALWSPDFPPARFEDAGVRPGGSDQVEF